MFKKNASWFYRIIFSLLFLLILTYGCKSSKNSVNKNEVKSETNKMTTSKVNKSKIPEDFTCSIQKTPCYGTCPTFKLNINSKGEVVYLGERFVDKIGVFKKTLNDKKLKELFELSQKAEFLALKDNYDNEGVTDLPSSTIGFTANGFKKSVRCRYQCPQIFHDIMKEAESIIGEDGYTKSTE